MTAETCAVRLVLAGVLGLALLGGGGAALAGPRIAIEPDSLSWGPVDVDPPLLVWPPFVEPTRELTVRNTGDAPLHVEQVAIAGNAAPFHFQMPGCSGGQVCTAPFTIGSGEAAVFVIGCDPAQEGTFDGTVTVTSDAENADGNDSIAISCQGVVPEISFSPDMLVFPVLPYAYPGDYGGGSAERVLTVHNDGAGNLAFGCSGLWEPNFSVSMTCDGNLWEVLPPGGSTSISVVFHPTPSGADGFWLFSNDPDEPELFVPMFAHPGSMEITVEAVPDLGPVLVGETSAPGIVRVRNSGTLGGFIYDVFLYPPRLSWVGVPPDDIYLEPGEAVEWGVTCTPETFGPQGDDLYFLADPEGSSHWIHIGCTGLAGQLGVGYPWISFGDVLVGATATREAHVVNSGNAATELTAITSDNPHFTAALHEGVLPVTVAPGEEVLVDVTFSPTDTSHQWATLTYEGSHGGGADPVDGYGAEPSAAVSPSAYDFGAVAAAAAPAKAFTLTNDGPAALTVSAAAVDSADFTVDGLAAGAVIAPGDGLVFGVRPTPLALGWRNGAIAIELDIAPPLLVPLTALAVDPGFAIETSDGSPGDYRLDLGAVGVGQPPSTGDITLRNEGAAPIEIAGCVVSGDPGFAVISACPLVIEPGTSATVTIAFDPALAKVYAATLSLAGSGFATGVAEIWLAGQGGPGGADADAGAIDADAATADAGTGPEADAGTGPAADAGTGPADAATADAGIGPGDDRGCGCSTSGGADRGALLALAWLAVHRRRRSARRGSKGQAEAARRDG